MANKFRCIAFALALVLAASVPYASSCSPTTVSNVPHGYLSEGMISKDAGTVSVWAYLESGVQRRDFSVFQTDDVRFALGFDKFFSASENKTIYRIAARAGGNMRASDGSGASDNFPEASIIIDDGSLSDYRYAWYSPVNFPERAWHLVTMKWDGSPNGTVSIYFDGKLKGSKRYSEKFDDGREAATMFSTGFLPGNGLGIGNISFYPCALSDYEILLLADTDKPSGKPPFGASSYGGSTAIMPGQASAPGGSPSSSPGYGAADTSQGGNGASIPVESLGSFAPAGQRVVSSNVFYSEGKKYFNITSVRTVHILFGLIPMEVEVQSKVDAASGSTVGQVLPWWYFIVAD